ncbi:hypothetical protein M436DRAFT_63118 [Aureobasidium namibiae CBS 147.97]|uniref:Uncharacterized protein n=1 Tax=Aureobasidium namibiae CBS 147.97 TaxID=1043004 RepID=A0A074WQ91_9PEZI|nr:uncharacterized protein M436DRAFT_63118 [Aureobasidium namibiae CBS 147.97]KEQ73754.1 hypothetical protein M436DRAFT_63118 [Aureobasidium namibiae CBS 147.97]
MMVVGERLELSFGSQQNYTQPLRDLLRVTFIQNKVVACNEQQGEEADRKDNNRKRYVWVIQSMYNSLLGPIYFKIAFKTLITKRLRIDTFNLIRKLKTNIKVNNKLIRKLRLKSS